MLVEAENLTLPSSSSSAQSPLPKVNFKANFDAALFMGQAVLG